MEPLAIDRFKQAVAEAKKELSVVQERLKDFKQLEQRERELIAFIDLGQRLMGEAEKPDERPEPYLFGQIPSEGRLAWYPKSILEGITRLLQEKGGQLSVGEIFSEFQKRGWKISNKTGREVIRGTIFRNKEKFEKVAPGTFRLSVLGQEHLTGEIVG